ncbi:hypothetical protein KYY02_28170 [Streptomyces pimonensis]|uniref:Uncharacterized protein n=1 Tax=Streptomyces pimonensis TaxID=2860288 RepID=A0ABV4J622_9ACTN
MTEASALKAKHRITLITGDRVAVSVYVSYDHGRTWKKTTVTKGKTTVKNPAKGKAVSFRARIADKKGNTSTVTICNAYHGT